jgi:hypothetical protein
VRIDTPVSADAQYCKWSTIFWMVLIDFAVRASLLLLRGTYRFDRADGNVVGEINNIAAPIGKGLTNSLWFLMNDPDRMPASNLQYQSYSSEASRS